MKPINIIYFAWINPKKPYKTIIQGQLQDLLHYGLLERSKLYIEICCEQEHLVQELRTLVARTLGKHEHELQFHTENKYEYYGIKTMYDLSQTEPDKTYLYFHSKGMTSQYDNVRDRHIFERTLTKGTLCDVSTVLDIFAKQPSVMKIGLFPAKEHGHNFLWFNFYWARGTYLRTCENPIVDPNRFYYELWSETGDNSLGTVYNLYERNERKYTLKEAGDILNRLRGTFPNRRNKI
jgi:hypothetical protein